MAAAPEIDLSVVVAAADANRATQAAITALLAACEGLSAEILIIGPAGSDASERLGTEARVTVRAGKPGALVPELWATGIACARGRVVALTTDHMTVSPGWARALIHGLEPPAAGAGGPIDLKPDAGLVDWAIFYLRYSAYLPSAWFDGPVAGEIAGDNAAYLLADLQRHAAEFTRGFWEVDFHRAVRGEGRTLRAVAAARAQFGHSYRPGTFLRQRFTHGRQFGHTRVQTGQSRRGGIVARAPLVPMVLAWRVARRVRADAAHRTRFVLSLPVFLIFAGAWAAGEAAGALLGEGRPAPA